MVLYIGTIIRKKGIFELPLIFEKVLDKCPEAKLIIIGSDSSDIRTGADSTWSLIQNMLNGKLISKVKYLGKIPHQEVQDYIKKANVCVFPTFAETQGMVTVESMAMHKPVVNSDKGWSREIIEDGVNGFLVNPKNHTQYAQRIIDLIQNEALCLSVGEAARVKVTDHFDIQELAKKNIDFYTLIIKQNNK
jgi:glycosyltransferase involved in cell wall biosynthesis